MLAFRPAPNSRIAARTTCLPFRRDAVAHPGMAGAMVFFEALNKILALKNLRDNADLVCLCSAALQGGILDLNTCPPEGGRYSCKSRIGRSHGSENRSRTN